MGRPAPPAAALAARRARRTPRRRPPAGRPRPAAARGPARRAPTSARCSPTSPPRPEPHARAALAHAAGRLVARRLASRARPARATAQPPRGEAQSARTARGSRRARGPASAARPTGARAIAAGCCAAPAWAWPGRDDADGLRWCVTAAPSRAAARSTRCVRDGAPAPAGRRPAPAARGSGRSWCPGRPPACAASTRTSPSATRGVPLVVEQVAAAPTGRRPPSTRRSTALALAWAVRDLAALRSRASAPPPGRRPSTSTRRGRRRTGVARHPHCGCAWDDGCWLTADSPVLAVELALHRPQVRRASTRRSRCAAGRSRPPWSRSGSAPRRLLAAAEVTGRHAGRRPRRSPYARTRRTGAGYDVSSYPALVISVTRDQGVPEVDSPGPTDARARARRACCAACSALRLKRRARARWWPAAAAAPLPGARTSAPAPVLRA